MSNLVKTRAFQARYAGSNPAGRIMMTYDIGSLLGMDMWMFDFHDSLIEKNVFENIILKYILDWFKSLGKRDGTKGVAKAFWISKNRERYTVKERVHNTFELFVGMPIANAYNASVDLSSGVRSVLGDLMELNKTSYRSMPSFDVQQLASHTAQKYGITTAITNYAETNHRIGDDGETIEVVSRLGSRAMGFDAQANIHWDNKPIDTSNRKRKAGETILEYYQNRHGVSPESAAYFTDNNKGEEGVKKMLEAAGVTIIDDYVGLARSLDSYVETRMIDVPFPP